MDLLAVEFWLILGHPGSTSTPTRRGSNVIRAGEGHDSRVVRDTLGPARAIGHLGSGPRDSQYVVGMVVVEIQATVRIERPIEEVWAFFMEEYPAAYLNDFA